MGKFCLPCTRWVLLFYQVLPAPRLRFILYLRSFTAPAISATVTLPPEFYKPRWASFLARAVVECSLGMPHDTAGTVSCSTLPFTVFWNATPELHHWRIRYHLEFLPFTVLEYSHLPRITTTPFHYTARGMPGDFWVYLLLFLILPLGTPPACLPCSAFTCLPPFRYHQYQCRHD